MPLVLSRSPIYSCIRQMTDQIFSASTWMIRGQTTFSVDFDNRSMRRIKLKVTVSLRSVGQLSDGGREEGRKMSWAMWMVPSC